MVKVRAQKSRKSKELGFVNFKRAKDAQRVRDAMDRRALNEKQTFLLNLIKKWSRRQYSSEMLSIKKLNRISG